MSLRPQRPGRMRARAGRAQHAVACLSGVCAALLLACALLAARRRPALDDPAALLADPALRAAVVERMIASTPSGFDSHPDPDVGYVLLAGEGTRQTLGHAVDASALGLRERSYALPKPPGTLRVVLLGDSYVFGWGVEAGERLGSVLEAELRERAPAFEGEIECLHLAVPSWNAAAECAFALRQLEALRPDLLVQVTVENDLDDNAGVRGFGAMSTDSPAHRDRADGRIHSGAPRALGAPASNLLAFGLDHESRSRLDEAARWFARLSSAVEEQGGRYLLVGNWDVLNGVLSRELEGRLPASRLVFLPAAFVEDQALRVSREDRHWSAAGHRELARMLLGHALAQGLVPALGLPPDPDLEREAASFFEAGRTDAERGARQGLDLAEGLLTELDFTTVDPAEAAQVHGGVDGEGRAAPYASLLLRRGAGTRLVVEGENISSLVLRGASVQVFADELALGELALGTPEPLVLDAALPPEVLARPFVSIRFVSTDYTYVGEDLRHCVAFRLKRVALVP